MEQENRKQKIVATCYPKDLEVGIEEMSVTYVQNPDTNDDPEHYQYLKITTQTTTSGSQMPYYVNLSIPNFDDETPGHWSLDLSEGIEPLLQDFKERLENKKETTKNT